MVPILALVGYRGYVTGDIEYTGGSTVSTADHINPDESLWHWMAFDLRQYRQTRGASLTDVGAIMGVARQSVSNFEAMRRRPGVEHVKPLDATWKTNGHFLRLLTFARLNHDPNWFREHIELEARALTLKIFEPLVVPGLLQTPDYARVALAAGSAPDIERALEARLARQEILTRPNPPRTWALLDEGVIDRPVGGPKVMRAQLAHLLEMSELPQVVLRILPRTAGYHVGLDGGFKIMLVSPEGEVAYTEAAEGGRLVLDGSGVQRFALRFDQIGADALGRAGSRELITQVMESMR